MPETRFSLVVGIRDTPHERIFAQRSLRASEEIDPSETIIGIDEPVDPDFLDVVETASSGHRKPHIIRVSRSKEWNMQLSHVIYECIKAASHERVLAYNIDSILHKHILDGYNQVDSQTPMVMYQERRMRRKFRDLFTGIVYRSNQILRPPDTGTYWIHRKSYLEDVDFAELRSVFNGCDTFLIEQFRAKQKNAVARSTIGADSLDCNNNEIPWRQFANGIWYGANPDKITGYFASRPNFKIRIKSILLDMPYLYKGFRWAMENPNHRAVTDAQSMTYLDFTHLGSKPVDEILDWKSIGKLGAGYM